MFNTLKYARRLEEAGLPRAHAEAHVQIIAEIVEIDMPTKQDMSTLETSLKDYILGTKTEVKHETSGITLALESEITGIRGELNELRRDLEEVKSDVSILKADVTVLKSDVAILKTDVAILKADVAVLKSDVATLKTDVAALRTEFRTEISNIRTEFRSQMAQLEYRLTIKLGTFITIAFGAAVSIIKLLQ